MGVTLRQHIPDSDQKRAFFSKLNQIIGGSLGLNSCGLYAYDLVWLLAHAFDAFFNKVGLSRSLMILGYTLWQAVLSTFRH